MSEPGDREGAYIDLGMELLDHQLMDRDGMACGKVDDVELEVADDGALYAVALVSGPGAWAERMAWRRLGPWWRGAVGCSADDLLIPLGSVTDIGPAITVDANAAHLATHRTEDWFRRHVVGRIFWSGVEPEAAHESE